MTRLEELARKHLLTETAPTPGGDDYDFDEQVPDGIMAFGRELIEECAKIAEKYGDETESIVGRGMALDIGDAIRSLALEADARFCKCSISVPADASNVKCAKCNLPLNSGAKQEFNRERKGE